jgi:hypothetical protein
MPDAPIQGRVDGAMVWTGTEMLIWGGTSADGSKHFADGAAYNPTTHTWRVLPAAPLGARTPLVGVWTGTEFIVWGGDAGQEDGAAYSPSTNSWRTLPALPGSTFGGTGSGMPAGDPGATAVWTGQAVQLLTWRERASQVASWSYDPARNAWTQGNPIAPRADAQISTAELVARGDTIDSWVAWSYQDSSDGIHDQVTGYTSTRSDGDWRPVAYRPALDTIGPVVDTGSAIMMGPAQLYEGFHPGPLDVVEGQLIDPNAGTTTALPARSGASRLDTYALVWTGGAALAYGSTVYTEGPGGARHLPGATAAYDPSADSWTDLAAAPLAGGESGVWTGSELLVWGLMYPAAQANGGNPDYRSTGLVFSAPAS